MSKKNKQRAHPPRHTPPRVGAPSAPLTLIASRAEWEHRRTLPDASGQTLTVSPLMCLCVAGWSSPEHVLCHAAMLYPSHIDVLFEPGAVDEAVRLAEPRALAEFYYVCKRFSEFDALVIETPRAREHIMALQPTRIQSHDLVEPAQHRVRAVVVASAARRALGEITGGKA